MQCFPTHTKPNGQTRVVGVFLIHGRKIKVASFNHFQVSISHPGLQRSNVFLERENLLIRKDTLFSLLHKNNKKKHLPIKVMLRCTSLAAAIGG